MSFIRVGKTAGGIRRKRSGVKKKPLPVWDDSIQDLSVHRASSEDLMYRKAIHESKNSLKSRLEQIEKNQKKGKPPKPTARQMAVMKEILYDKQQLHDVLSRSDQMMSVVQDIFGDNPKRFTGFPSVTIAPGITDPTHNGSLVGPEADVQTQLEALSQSIMDGTALNESTDEDYTDDEAPEPIVYQPRLNLDRFHQFLAAAQEQNGTLSTISGGGPVTISNAAGPSHSTKLPDGSAITHGSADGSIFETPPQKQGPSRSHTPKSAANDTAKIQRSKKHCRTEADVSVKAPLSLEDLKQVLMSLQGEICELEQQTGISQETDSAHSDSFSGYTMALVDSVTRLTRHLRETERRLQVEMTIREQLAQDVVQLRTVVDALTSDIILTQEEYAKVITEFGSYKVETQSEIANIKGILQKVLSGMAVPGNQGLPTDQTLSNHGQLSSAAEVFTPPKQPQQNQELHSEDVPEKSVVMPHPLVHPSDLLQPAILLSPPVQRTRLPDRKTVQEQPAEAEDTYQPVRSNKNGAESGDGNSTVMTKQPHAQPPAVVNVPRPVPLVQTNIPFNYSTGQCSEQIQLDEVRSFVERAPAQLPLKPNQTSGHFNQPIRTGLSSHTHQPITVSQSSSDSSQSVNQGPSSASSRQQNLGGYVPVRFGQSLSAFKLVSGAAAASINQQQLQQLSDNENILENGIINRDVCVSKSGGENPVLASQIAELNRQHEEAQRRLQSMLQQQHALRLNTVVSEKESNVTRPQTHNSVKQTNNLVEQVSPDVSPISERSSSVRGGLPANQRPAHSVSSQSVGGKPQRITVSVPTMELDISQFSDVSPSPHIDQFIHVS